MEPPRKDTLHPVELPAGCVQCALCAVCTPGSQLLCAVTLAGVGFGNTAVSESFLSLLHKVMARLRVVPATLVLGIQTETLYGHQAAINLTDVY